MLHSPVQCTVVMLIVTVSLQTHLEHVQSTAQQPSPYARLLCQI